MMVQRSLHRSRLRISHLFVLCLLLAAAQDVTAQVSEPTNEPTVGTQGGRFGVGFTSSSPAYGLSGTLQLSQTVTAEVVLGLLGTVSHYGARGWYRFNRNASYDLYAYGAVGVYRYNYRLLRIGYTESVLGLGAGLGIEAGLKRLLKDQNFPPIFVHAELGLSFASFENYGGYSTMAFGAGLHYRFGG